MMTESDLRLHVFMHNILVNFLQLEFLFIPFLFEDYNLIKFKIELMASFYEIYFGSDSRSRHVVYC